ncbi:polysaccharide deacetylase family protein [Sinomonas sp. P47F7]|uniref:polysaccharide deacetylase family protein n=1 Tax=Sinomonas sp. P47F7 TaxID=3410987 RepID=UPI003BF5F280
MPPTLPHVARRAVLAAMGASIAALVTSCEGPQDAGPTAAAPQALLPEATEAPSPSPAPTTAKPAPHEFGAADRKAIEARFAGRAPHDWGLAIPGLVTKTMTSAVALTFDACGGPGGTGLDKPLIDTLRKLHVPATLFLNSRWIQANQSLSAELAADPLFEIGNHGTAHVPLSVTGRSAYGIHGTGSIGAVLDELLGNAPGVHALAGSPVPWFRPGTAYYDDVAAAITSVVGLVPVNFAVNADAGATLPAPKVSSILGGVRPGDIVISHMNRPGSGTSGGYAEALPALLGKGIHFTTLSQSGLSVPGISAPA